MRIALTTTLQHNAAMVRRRPRPANATALLLMNATPSNPTPMHDLLTPLLADHVLARRVLDAMSSESQQLEHGAPIDLTFWRSVLEFYDTYFDSVHQKLEDEVLLPLLFEEGLGNRFTAAAQMSREHDRLRPCLTHLRNAIHVNSSFRLRAAVRTFWSLHHSHMDLEERHIFPMASAMLGSAEDQRYRDALAKINDEAVNEQRLRATEIVERVEANFEAARRRCSGQSD
jgi:hemerythrin-like domain-containing protein